MIMQKTILAIEPEVPEANLSSRQFCPNVFRKISVVESCLSSKSNLRVDHKWDSNLLSMKTLKTGGPFKKLSRDISLEVYLGTKCLQNANYHHVQLSYLLCQPGIKKVFILVSFLYSYTEGLSYTYVLGKKLS